MANVFNYNIGGIGPNTNSTQGYFQYLTTDDLIVDNEIFANKITVDNNLLVEGVLKTPNIYIGTFAADGTFTEDYRLDETLTSIESDISALDTRVTALENAP